VGMCPLYVIKYISPSGLHIVVYECRMMEMLLWCNTWNLNGVYISFGVGGGGWNSVVDNVYLTFTMLHIHSVKNLGH
jgi:hypothetical protein